jgi:hypothetical protein
MILFSTFTSIFALFPVASVLSGQVPVVNSVVGGVPPRKYLFKPQAQSEATTVAAAASPGTLRGVVENSGICGEYIYIKREVMYVFTHSLSLFQRRLQAYIKHPGMAISPAHRQKIYGEAQKLHNENYSPHDLIVRFWFFASRKNPNTAPLVLRFNGGVHTASIKHYLIATDYISLAGKLKHDRTSTRKWTMPHY